MKRLLEYHSERYVVNMLSAQSFVQCKTFVELEQLNANIGIDYASQVPLAYFALAIAFSVALTSSREPPRDDGTYGNTLA